MPTAVAPTTWAEVFNGISPIQWANYGVIAALVLCIIGAGWGILITGASLVGAAVKSPRIRSRNLVSVIFCEATAIYGVIIAIMIANKITIPTEAISGGTFKPGFNLAQMSHAGYALLSAGLGVGITNLASGLAVGVAGSACALADAQNPSMFSKMLMIEIFAGALGIFGVIVAIIQISTAQFPE